MPRRSLYLRLTYSLLRIATASFLGVALCLWFLQYSLIYHPRPYEEGEENRLPPGWEALPYTTSQGPQVAYCRPPAAPSFPARPLRRTCVFFGGNGSLALNWLDLIADEIPPGQAALLLDYPGYGSCAGRSSPATILESTEAAAEALARRLHLSRSQLEPTWCLIGHSLGAASALQFATRHPVQQLILLAPFTRMVEMAQMKVGWPLAELCRHRFDNAARLRELAQRQPPPPVAIFHGAEDDFIPPRMSRQLAAAHPGFVTLQIVPGASHDSIVQAAQAQWLPLLRPAGE